MQDLEILNMLWIKFPPHSFPKSTELNIFCPSKGTCVKLRAVMHVVGIVVGLLCCNRSVCTDLAYAIFLMMAIFGLMPGAF